MKKNPTLWYTRCQGTIRGPFTPSVIKNNLLLGRLDPRKDEVSTDQNNWQKIYSQAQLYSDLSGESAIQSKKYLDERDGFDRRHIQLTQQQIPQRREDERRSKEVESDIERRQFRTLLMQKLRQKKAKIFWPTIGIGSALITLFIFAFIYAKPFPDSLSDCSSEPTSGVNWTNCLKPQLDLPNSVLENSQLRNSQLVGSNLMNSTLSGSDMAYIDLRFANLSYSQLNNVLLLGADLKNADFSYADLSDSDLSYADLRNANLGASKLENTRFDHAIWIDGKLCLPPSIGQCITEIPQTP